MERTATQINGTQTTIRPMIVIASKTDAAKPIQKVRIKKV